MHLSKIRSWGRLTLIVAGGSLLAGWLSTAMADVDLPTKFTNRGTIANTRHNMTQRPADNSLNLTGASMNQFRNDYEEVCVYCHTPHGGNANVTLPLWNRTIKATTYVTYDLLGTSTLTQTVSQPGPASLSCLSCHDGQVAIDSVINMPGSGKYLAEQATSQNNAFLNNNWNNSGTGPDATVHIGLNAVNPGDGCLACHSKDAGLVGASATDFRIFAIGTDLKNDHPVGVTFPAAGPGVDFNQPNATRPGIKWFDTGNNVPDKGEVRLYDSGQGFEVECASCHDPHGVPSGSAGSAFIPTFLRVANSGAGAGSKLCLTCHVK